MIDREYLDQLNKLVCDAYRSNIQELITKYGLKDEIEDKKVYVRYDDYSEWLCDIFDLKVGFYIGDRIESLEKVVEHTCDCPDCDSSYLRGLVECNHNLSEVEKWLKDFREMQKIIPKQAEKYIKMKAGI